MIMWFDIVEVFAGKMLVLSPLSGEDGGGKYVIARGDAEGSLLRRLDLRGLGKNVELQVRDMPTLAVGDIGRRTYCVLMVEGNERKAIEVRKRFLGQLSDRL